MPVELPDKMADFVDQVVDSFVTWDLLIGFSRRPESTGSAATFGTLLGRPADDVEGALERLVEKGLLRAVTTEAQEVVFHFNPDSPLKAALGEFADFNDSQENRLKILSRLLHRGVSH